MEGKVGLKFLIKKINNEKERDQDTFWRKGKTVTNRGSCIGQG